MFVHFVRLSFFLFVKMGLLESGVYISVFVCVCVYLLNMCVLSPYLLVPLCIHTWWEVHTSEVLPPFRVGGCASVGMCLCVFFFGVCLDMCACVCVS